MKVGRYLICLLICLIAYLGWIHHTGEQHSQEGNFNSNKYVFDNQRKLRMNKKYKFLLTESHS